MLTNEKQARYARFEQTLAFHCAPAMAGIKSADLISWSGTPEETREMLAHFNGEMERTGIRFHRLCCCNGRTLILVYRPNRLREQLTREDVRAFLEREGYPVDEGVETMLEHLALRMGRSNGFPHEVGLFLGYPVEDVEGFCKYGGRECKYSGLWKVYSDVERAQACFHRYNCCRRALCRRVEEGCPLSRVFRAA